MSHLCDIQMNTCVFLWHPKISQSHRHPLTTYDVPTRRKQLLASHIQWHSGLFQNRVQPGPSTKDKWANN